MKVVDKAFWLHTGIVMATTATTARSSATETYKSSSIVIMKLMMPKRVTFVCSTSTLCNAPTGRACSIYRTQAATNALSVILKMYSRGTTSCVVWFQHRNLAEIRRIPKSSFKIRHSKILNNEDNWFVKGMHPSVIERPGCDVSNVTHSKDHLQFADELIILSLKSISWYVPFRQFLMKCWNKLLAIPSARQNMTCVDENIIKP
jgi:hypothetical protein